MTKEMLLEIVTPQGIILSRKVTYISAPGVMGGFGIMANHIPFYSILKAGVLEFEDGLRKKIAIEQGVLECVRNKITVMTQGAEVIG